MNTPLADRIAGRRPAPRPLSERKPEARLPEWRRRALEGNGHARDTTTLVLS